ncbi:MAG: NADH-quinone oxidoreductase subunit M, partial [Pseudomonadales bacterium]|nr:NADH-quinone oxidoreductase subunit M [Pseudomonadales bacterium]
MDPGNSILSSLIWLPILGGIVVLLLGDDGDAASPRAALMRMTALVVSLLTFVISLYLYASFDTSTAAMQFVERAGWIGALNAFYHLGVDGISTPLILLTAFLTPLVVIAGWDSIKTRPAQYFAAFLILEGLMIGVFSALDGLLFYVLWEAMLVPMFLIIGVWGGERRIYAAIKFILFTMVGSLPMLVALITMGLAAGAGGVPSFALTDLYDITLSPAAQGWACLALVLAFAIKVPMWPLHTWLPDAHVEAPTGGSVILAGVLLKMGTYGFVRFVLPLFPEVLVTAAPVIAVLAVVGIVYGALVAMVQPDLKKLVAYSSVSHLGFVMLGIASLNVIGIEGAVYQMIGHGLSTGALFLLV